MATILCIDDEKRMLELLDLFLTPNGFQCLISNDGQKGLQLLDLHSVDLVLLDVMMPFMNGWQVCEAIRQKSDVPIIMLTARSDKSDVVKGLHAGADDYIIKPFDEQELVARIHAVLRRSSPTDSPILVRDGFILDLAAYTFHMNDQTLTLTLKEFQLLETFMTHPTRTYTREQLLAVVWPDRSLIELRTVDSHIRNLRDKLKTAGFPTSDYIVTVWGIGYKWK
jgi:DNA-binding response OmpR family regulator